MSRILTKLVLGANHARYLFRRISIDTDVSITDQLSAHEAATRSRYSQVITRLVCYSLRTWTCIKERTEIPDLASDGQHPTQDEPSDITSEPEIFDNEQHALEQLEEEQETLLPEYNAPIAQGDLNRAKALAQLNEHQMTACAAYNAILQHLHASSLQYEEPAETTPVGADPASRLSYSADGNYLDDDVQRALHELLLSILIQETPSDFMSNPGISFLVFASATQAGSWSSGYRTAAIITSLKWGYHLAAYRQATLDRALDQNAWREQLTPILPYISNTRACTFEWTYNLGSKLAVIHAGAYRMPSTAIYNHQILLRGQEVRFHLIVQFVHRIRDRLFEVVKEILSMLDALDLLDFDWRSQEIQDRWAENDAPYSFLDDTSNHHWPVASFLWDKLVKTGKFHSRAGAESIQWNSHRLNKLLTKINDVQLLLMATIHLTSGGTSRASEISGQFRRNANRQRTMYWMFDRALFRPAYHKGSWTMHDKDQHVRAADWEVSVLCIIMWRYFTELQFRVWLSVFKVRP